MPAVRSESGQVIPFVGVVLLAVLLGMCALAIDMGDWYRASRHAQSVADAAALAAIQDLPNDPSAAQADATTYAAMNHGALASTPLVTTTEAPYDTITVRAVESAPAFFAKIFGMNSVTVHATAAAQISAADTYEEEDWSSTGTGRPLPFALQKSQAPDPNCNCYGKPIELCYGPDCAVAGGQFGLVDFADTKGGTPPGTIADWITNGYHGDLALGDYYGIPGNKTMPKAVRDAMDALVAQRPTIVLPVYDGTTDANGANMMYHVVGWTAFKLTGFDPDGSRTTLYGSFQTLDTKTHGSKGKFFGVGHIKLTK